MSVELLDIFSEKSIYHFVNFVSYEARHRLVFLRTVTEEPEMKTIIHTNGLRSSTEIRAHLARRFTFSLQRFEDRISLVEFHFKGDKYPENLQAEKCILVRVRLRDRPPVVVESVSRDIYTAINVAAKRCKRAVNLALKRPRQDFRFGLRQVAKESARINREVSYS